LTIFYFSIFVCFRFNPRKFYRPGRKRIKKGVPKRIDGGNKMHLSFNVNLSKDEVASRVKSVMAKEDKKYRVRELLERSSYYEDSEREFKFRREFCGYTVNRRRTLLSNLLTVYFSEGEEGVGVTISVLENQETEKLARKLAKELKGEQEE